MPNSCSWVITKTVPGPPAGVAITDWSRTQLAELDDGAIAVSYDQRVRWIFEPDVALWREPPNDVTQLDVRSISAAGDGLYLVAGSPPQVVRMADVNRVEPVTAPLSPECAAPAVFATDVGPMAVGCGKVRVVEAGTTREIDVPAGTSIVTGPRGRPPAVATTNGELSLLQ